MKQIKFRGQLIHSREWVYGTYHYSADNEMHYILNRERFLERFDQGEWALHEKEVHQVIPESVGQFTGLHDKNGVEIYFKDLVKAPSGNVFEVVWHDEEMKIALKSKDTYYNFNVPLYEIIKNPELT
jgi:uncharacterized phage protein (TIGR01671 family)